MISREQKLAAAKRKLQRFQKTRVAGAIGPTTPPDGSSSVATSPDAANSNYFDSAISDAMDNDLSSRDAISYTVTSEEKLDTNAMQAEERGQGSSIVSVTEETPELKPVSRPGSPKALRITTATKLPTLKRTSPTKVTPTLEHVKRDSAVRSNEDVTGNVADLQSENSFLKLEVQSVLNENGFLISKVKTLESEIKTMKKEDAAGHSRIQALEKLVAELTSKFEREEANAKRLSASVSTLQSDLTSAHDSLSVCRQELELEQGETKTLIDELSQKSERVGRLEAEVEDLKLTINSLESKAISPVKVSQDSAEVDRYQSEISELRVEIEKLHEQERLDKAEKANLERLSQDLQEQIGSTTTDLRNMERLNVELQEKILSLSKTVQSTDTRDEPSAGEAIACDFYLHFAAVELNFETTAESTQNESDLIEFHVLTNATLEERADHVISWFDEMNFKKPHGSTFALREEVKAWKSQLKEMVSRHQGEIEGLEHARERLSDDKVNALERLTASIEERNLLVDQLAVSEDKVRSVSQQLEVLEEERRSLSQQLSLVEDERQSLSQQLSESHDERQTLSVELATSMREQTALLERITALEQERNDVIGQRGSETEQTMNSLEKLNTRNSELEEQISQLQQEKTFMEQTIGDLELQVNDALVLKNQVTQLQSEIHNYSQKVSHLQQTTVETTIVEDLKSEIAALNSEVANYSQQLSHLQQTTVDASMMDDLNDQIATLTEEVDRLTGLNNQLVEEARKRFEMLQEERDALFTQNENMREAGVKVVENLKNLEEENDALLAEIEELRAAGDSYQKLFDENITLRADLDAVQAENAKMREAGAEMMVIKAELEENERDLNEQILKLREAATSVVEDHRKMEAEFFALNDEVVRLEADLADSQAKVHDVTQKLELTESLLMDLRETVEREKVRCEEIERRYKDLERKSIADIQDLVDTMRNLTEEHSSCKTEIKAKQAELDKVVQELKTAKEEMEDLRINLEHSLNAIQEKESEVAYLQGRVEASELNTKRLAGEIAQLEEELNSTRTQISADSGRETALNELQNAIQEYQAENGELRLQLDELESRYERLCEDGEAHTQHLENQLREAVEERNYAQDILTRTEQERDMLAQNFKLLEDELLDVRRELSFNQDHASNAMRESTEKCSYLESELTMALEKLASLEQDLDSARQNLQAAISEKDSASKQLEKALQQSDLAEKMSEDMQRLQSELSSALELNASLETALRTAESKFNDEVYSQENLVNENHRLQMLLDDQCAKAVKVENEMAILLSEADKTQQDLNSTIVNLESQLESLHISRSEEQHRIEELTRNLDEAENSLQLLRTELSLSESQREVSLGDLEKVLKSMSEEIAGLKEQIRQKSQDEADNVAEQERLRASLAESWRENDDSKLRINELVDENGRLSDELRNVTSEIGFLQHSLNNCASKLQQAEQDATRYREDSDHLRVTVSDQATRLDELQAMLDAREKQKSQGDETIQKLRDELEHVRLRMKEEEEMYRQQLDTTTSTALESKSKLMEEIQQIRENFRKSEEKRRELEERHDKLLNQMAEMGHGQPALPGLESQEEINRRITILEEQRDFYRNESLSRQVTIDKLTQRIINLETDLKGFGDSLKRQQFEDSNSENSYVQIVKSQTARISDLELTIAAQKRDIQTKEETIANLRRQNNSSDYTQDQPGESGMETADVLFSAGRSPRSVKTTKPQSPTRKLSTSTVNGKTSSLERDLEMLRLELKLKDDEIESVHNTYKDIINELEDKVQKQGKVSSSSIQSMEVYRDELLKKNRKLEALEGELMRLTAAPRKLVQKDTPDTSMLDIFKAEEEFQKAGRTVDTLTELLQSASNKKESLPGKDQSAKTLDALQKQISLLVKSTEANMDISRKIFDEVSLKMNATSPNVVVTESSESARRWHHMLKAQNALMEEHRRALGDIHKISNLIQETGSVVGSPIRKSGGEWNDSELEFKDLVSQFVKTIESYKDEVSILLQQGDDIARKVHDGLELRNIDFSLSRFSERMVDVRQQHVMLLKQISYLSSLLPQSETTQGYAEGLSYSKTANPSPDHSREYRLSSREYAELVTKAASADRLVQQVDSANALRDEYAREIQVLKEALEAISLQFGSTPTSDSQTLRLLQKQIDELKKVWSHELAANTILRNLIAKSQAEHMAAEQSSRTKETRLREEFDELILLFEEADGEASKLRTQLADKERLLEEAEQRADERLNKQFFELEQQHQEQTQQLEDMYDKERSALNKLVSNLEKERNRLIGELSSTKTSLNSKIAEFATTTEDALRKCRDLERTRDANLKELDMMNDTLSRSQEEIAHIRAELSYAREEIQRQKALNREVGVGRESDLASMQTLIDRLREQARNLENERNLLSQRLRSAEDKEVQRVEELRDLETRLQRKDQMLLEDRREMELRFERRERQLLEQLKEIEVHHRELETELMNERRLAKIALNERASEWEQERNAMDEEISRYRGSNTVGSIANERLDQAVKTFRTQKDNLERTLSQRDAQIRNLEIRIQELLQSQGDNQSYVPDQIRESEFTELHNQLAAADEARRMAEAQFAFEKDRAKRLASKCEELKRRLVQQQHLLQQQDEAINSAIRPGPRGGSLEDQLRQEVSLLRKEMLTLKKSNNDVLSIIRETLINTLGEVSIDVEDARTGHLRIDMIRLREQMGSLISEVVYMRALVNRLLLWRADLKYQKLYLSLKVEDLLASQKVTLSFIQGMGVNAPIMETEDALTPARKMRRCVNAVIGVFRMMLMAKNWQSVLQENSKDFFMMGESDTGNFSDHIGNLSTQEYEFPQQRKNDTIRDSGSRRANGDLMNADLDRSFRYKQDDRDPNYSSLSIEEYESNDRQKIQRAPAEPRWVAPQGAHGSRSLTTGTGRAAAAVSPAGQSRRDVGGGGRNRKM
ncbi:hypothetical protein HDU76_009466 [Blyttiomyces sp. JEL0837]|nr:hypothetical protein HDU76_009466 [Blyttiomyces sp. JEL0837]